MVWQLISAGISAMGQMAAGQAAKEAADLDAFNIETQRELSKAEALQRHNDRLEQYRYNTKANIAAFSASGRDVGSNLEYINSDRSVAAFLERQKEIATQDTKRSDFMGAMEAMKLKQQATAMRVEGRARKQAAMIGAFSTMAQGFADYQSSKAGKA